MTSVLRTYTQPAPQGCTDYMCMAGPYYQVVPQQYLLFPFFIQRGILDIAPITYSGPPLLNVEIGAHNLPLHKYTGKYVTVNTAGPEFCNYIRRWQGLSDTVVIQMMNKSEMYEVQEFDKSVMSTGQMYKIANTPPSFVGQRRWVFKTPLVVCVKLPEPYYITFSPI
jgi:hypothetical protein